VNIVHDELVFEVGKASASESTSSIEQVMVEG
jgi:DNA polymerase I-like protein with 3'-5' exonuclease and polymerase domains